MTTINPKVFYTRIVSNCMIEIRKEISELEYEVWRFNKIDYNNPTVDFVFVFYGKFKKESKRHKNYLVIERWDSYDKRHSNINEPELSEIIRSEALSQAMGLVRIKTWTEKKNNA